MRVVVAAQRKGFVKHEQKCAPLRVSDLERRENFCIVIAGELGHSKLWSEI